jgi:release factor glutamine methyltransferase
VWARLRWLALDRRAQEGVRLRRLNGMDLIVLPGVLDPTVFRSSGVLARAIEACATAGSAVLDLGTGCGVGAIAAARAGATRVVAVDDDPVATRCAALNARLAGLDPIISVRVGDLFRPVAGERYDLVAFNPPWMRDADAGQLRHALVADRGLAERFASGVGEHLCSAGRVLLVLPDTAIAATWLDPLRERGFELRRSLVEEPGGERLIAWLAGPAPSGQR